MSDLRTERDGELLVVTLNRPEKRNALSLDMLSQLEVAIQAAEDDDSIHAVVVTGEGEKAFSAGMDLAFLFEYVSSSPNGEKIRRVQRGLQDLFLRLEALEKPVIAAIEGVCVGGGFELALSCDLRIASSDATFGLPEVKIGMLPDLGGTSRLARFVGPGLAKEWVMTGRLYPSVRALELGLINELVVPREALLRAKHVAREIAANGPLAVGWAKRIIDRGLAMSLRDSFELEQDAMSEILVHPQLKEGAVAFLEKRPPKFRG